MTNFNDKIRLGLFFIFKTLCIHKKANNFALFIIFLIRLNVLLITGVYVYIYKKQEPFKRHKLIKAQN